MRLIDADELLTAFPVDDEPMLTKSCVRMTIQHMPTIGLPYKKPEIIKGTDLVPVVRCRDCKHLGTFRGKLYCRHNCGIVEPKENDFCSRGERKE